MNPLKLLYAALCLFLSLSHLQAQDKVPIKFGKVTLEDFNLSKYKFDSGAAAVVVADLGYSYFEGNNKGWFTLIFKHSKRMKVLNKNGFDAATVEMLLYQDGNTVEKLENLKAVTYNIENGEVTQTKLESKSVFTEKYSKNLVLKKFTFPAVKEGSIIEYSYTQESDFLSRLQPWEFQGEYPEIWSEYEVSIPEYFKYVFIGQGYQAYNISTNNTSNTHYSVNTALPTERPDYLTLDGKLYENRWVMKDVPPLKEEKFTSTIKNHIAKIEFQLSRYMFPNQPIREIMGNWPDLSRKLMENENFGSDVLKNNAWMDDDLKAITKGAPGKLEQAQKIYAYVRDNFSCSQHYGSYVENPLKTVFKNKNGSEAEINILLTAMLNHANIKTDPVILSTRSHGFANEIYPLMERFNYIVCAANIDNAVYYLDASQSRLGFGRLPDYCYNGHARLINTEHPHAVYLYADSLKEQKTTMVFITNDEKGGGVLNGSFQSLLGHTESYNIREELSKKQEKEFFKDIKSTYTSEIEIRNTAIDSLKQLEFPATIRYDFVIKHPTDEDIIYFTPLLSESQKDNPFKAAERRYPVEMPYTSDETYILNMEIPTGYVVEELPKSAKVAFNDNDGFFEYMIAKDDNNVQLRSRIKINRANFSQDDYNSLREFYGYIVKKQSEQIVFKKKK